MIRSADERFSDILLAIDRCRVYRAHLMSEDQEFAAMAFDAILRNLAVIDEAVRALPEETTESMPDIPWSSIAGLRNIVIHEYFRVDPDLIADIVDNYLDHLAQTLRG